jgi:polyisoprenoid-binding protein YceI
VKKTLLNLFFLIFIGGLSTTLSFAESQYAFTCDGSKIKGSIKYSVIGRYNSDFKECSGMIVYDAHEKQFKSVQLKIKTKSIHSNCEWCDKIVISKQLLNAEQYPLIVFEGKDFKKDSEGYWVKANIDLHGVTKELNSQFNVEENIAGYLSAKGKWILRRKDFNIIWNKILDHGGVLVGDHITVDWEILAKKI